MIRELAENGQIATQYVDMEGEPAHAYPFNPAGSVHAVEEYNQPGWKDIWKNVPL